MCGEKSQLLCAAASCEGSPPRVRGKGKWSYHITKMRGDHPRVCGEKQVLAYFMQTLPGSPPRMRGKAEVALHADFPEWITPAYAGKSWFKLTRRRGHWGSPPRVRGKVPKSLYRCLVTGITPAHAGKSAASPKSPPESEDHPRVCGEKAATPNVEAFYEGSPPRMRGKVRLRQGFHLCDGITPACAGKSVDGAGQSEGGGDHPRVCGEKASTRIDFNTKLGSPPRVRGKVKIIWFFNGFRGITPACAGKRPTAKGCSSGSRDYPRVCGEKTPDASSTTKSIGSPPRMRGKGLLQVFIPEPLRITPACAGKSIR